MVPAASASDPDIDSELEDGSPQEIWVLPTELFPYEDYGVSYNQAEGSETLSQPATEVDAPTKIFPAMCQG